MSKVLRHALQSCARYCGEPHYSVAFITELLNVSLSLE